MVGKLASQEANLKESIDKIANYYKDTLRPFNLSLLYEFSGFSGFEIPKTAIKNDSLYVGEAAGFQDPLFGFGAGETTLRHPFSEFGPVPQRRTGAILLHIITAGIICYAIKKNKPILGFLTAIIIHTGFNLIIDWAVR